MDKKKERAENWTKEEKDILMHLIKDSRAIIENKNTDTNTNKKKIAEWNIIHQKFTELTGNKRVVAQLKGQWRRMKVSAKKNIAHYKRAIKSTGGGEKPPSPSPEDQEIMAICPVDFIEDQNDFDSNAMHSIINIPSMSSTNIKNVNIIDSAEIQVISDCKISYGNTPSMSSFKKKNINLLDSAEVLVLSDNKISYENTAPMITDLSNTEKKDNEMLKCKKKINFDDILLNNSIELVDENSGNGSRNEQKKQQPLKDTIILQENTSTLNKRKKKQENGKMLEKHHINESILQTNKEYKERLLELQKKEIDLRILYQERELQQQSIRHNLETEALQLEVEIKKKQLLQLL